MNKVLTPSSTLFSAQPNSLKAIQILTVFKLVLALGMFIVFTIKDITIGAVGPQIILYTWFGYLAMAGGIFLAIRKKNLAALRAALIADFAISIPATAVIGFVVSAVSAGLTFLPSVRNWFQ